MQALTSLRERHVGRMIDGGIASGAATVKLTNRACECRCHLELHNMQTVNNIAFSIAISSALYDFTKMTQCEMIFACIRKYFLNNFCLYY